MIPREVAPATIPITTVAKNATNVLGPNTDTDIYFTLSGFLSNPPAMQ